MNEKNFNILKATVIIGGLVFAIIYCGPLQVVLTVLNGFFGPKFVNGVVELIQSLSGITLGIIVVAIIAFIIYSTYSDTKYAEKQEKQRAEEAEAKRRTEEK